MTFPKFNFNSMRNIKVVVLLFPDTPTGDQLIRGGEISKIYTCPRTTGYKKALVRTKALLARTQINTKA